MSRADLAGKKLLAEQTDDTPLIGARILRLIDQNMVDALVEFVLDPWPRILPRQQIHCTHDQIVEIEKTVCLFHLLVAADQIVDQNQRGKGQGEPGAIA